eukprot:scaffold2627_cov421-Prasinococcus_capsulatus_cf.AAC.4
MGTPRPRTIANSYPYTGAIASRIVRTIHAEEFSPSYRNLLDEGHQIVWYALGILSYPARRVRSDRVEVPQQHNVPLRIRGANISQNLLDEELRPT